VNVETREVGIDGVAVEVVAEVGVFQGREGHSVRVECACIG
jgi:hypothetical protein